MNRTYRPYARPFSDDDIAAQFEGMEIEFDDKATLFPVQVEKDERPRRRTSDALHIQARALAQRPVNRVPARRRSTIVKPLGRR